MLNRFLKKFRAVFAITIFCLFIIAFLGQDQITRFLSAVLIQFQFVPGLIRLATGTGFLFIFIVMLTLVFGRVYCSFLCPLGIFQDLLIRLSACLGITKRHQFQRTCSGFQYTVFGITMVSLALGSAIMIDLLDPYSVFGKIAVHFVKPLFLFGNNIMVNALEAFDLFWVATKRPNPVSITVVLVTAGFLGIILWLSFFRGRLYCNSVCPVGLLLAAITSFSVLKVRMETGNCLKCSKCVNVCKAGCIDIAKLSIDHSRCVTCFNCLNVCEGDVIAYTCYSGAPTPEPTEEKRRFLLSAVTVGSVFLSACSPFRLGKWGRSSLEGPLLPPGSISMDNYSRLCTACQLCVSACPTHVLTPTLDGFGLAGLALPGLSVQKAHCDFECNACGHICPTGAIGALPLDVKQQVRIGKASLNKELCVIHTKKKHCGACGEACPTHAIFPVEKNQVIFPEIHLKYCIGCGACQHACPTNPKAIVVTSIPVHEVAEKYAPGRKASEEVPDPKTPFPF